MEFADGDKATVAVRSEDIALLPAGEEGIPATVREKSFSAGMLRITLLTAAREEIVASRHGIDIALAPGEPVTLRFTEEHAAFVEAEDEKPETL